MPDVLTRWLRLYDNGTGLVLNVVVAVAYVTMFLAANHPFTLLQTISLVLLGAAYLFLCYFDIGDAKNRPVLLGGYFAILVALCAAIGYASQLSGAFWLLLLPIVVIGTQLLPTRGLIVLCATEMLAFVLVVHQVTGNWQAAGQLTLPFLPALIFVVVFARLRISEQRARTQVERLNGELAAANQQLRDYAAQAEELATSTERNRLAREIHDSVGHFLTSINVQIEAARVLIASDPQRAANALDKAQSLTRESLTDLRRSVAALRGGPIGGRPLPEALAALIGEARSAGLVGEIHLLGEPRSLPPPIENTLYRAAQEALTNVRKHALASRVDLTIQYAENEVRLMVRDNGVGSRQSTGTGFGLFGVQERVHIAGGNARITTAPGQGFVLEVVLPL